MENAKGMQSDVSIRSRLFETGERKHRATVCSLGLFQSAPVFLRRENDRSLRRRTIRARFNPLPSF